MYLLYNNYIVIIYRLSSSLLTYSNPSPNKLFIHMSPLTQTEQASVKSKNTLTRRRFLQLGALLTAWLALAACTPIKTETDSAEGQGLETTLKLMRGEMPSIKETVEMLQQLGIQKESQLAGIMIDLVRLQPEINVDELLSEIGNSNESINQRISDLLRRLSQEVDLFHYDHPVNHRMALAQAKAREEGLAVNDYLARQLFEKIELLINKCPDLVGLFPSFCPWAVCVERRTIPQEAFQQVQLALYYHEKLQPFFTSGFVPENYDHLFMAGSVAQKVEEANWISSQGIIDEAHESMLVSLFPMIPEEFVFQSNEMRLGDRSSTIDLFGEQLTDICLYLLRRSVDNEVIFQKIQLLYSTLQQQLDPSKIVSQDELRQQLMDPAHENKLRQAISKSIAGIAINQRANLAEQFLPIKKPMTVINFKEINKAVVIPEESFPTSSTLYQTADLFIPSHRPNNEGVMSVYSEFIPLLHTDPQDFTSRSGPKGLRFYYLDNRIVAVSGQNLQMFAQIHPTARSLTIQGITHKTKGEFGAAIDDTSVFFEQGKADAIEWLGELVGIEDKNSIKDHRVIGTFAVCKTLPQEYITNATALEHPGKSLFWVTITQGPDNLYYAYNPEKFPKDKGPHYASINQGILTVQKDSASTATGQQFRVLDELSPGYYDARLAQIPQALFDQLLRQMQPEETTKKIALLQRQALLTTNSGGIHKRQYVVVPKETATAYLVTRAPITGDIISQTEIGSFSRDPQPVLGANLTTVVNADGKLCLRLATIRRNGLGNGSPEVIVMVPKDQVEVLEVPTLEADLQHHAYSQATVFAAFSVVSKFLNTNIGGEFDLGYALYGALQELIRMNSGIGTDINP